MHYLFTPQGTAQLINQLEQENLIALDFDGTLAPITSYPEAAQMRPGTRRLLEEICKSKKVVIVSGRSLPDLKARSTMPNVLLIGNHGVESELRDYSQILQAAAATCKSWKLQLSQIIGQASLSLGIDIEDKVYSLSLHYRRSTHYAQCLDFIIKVVGQLVPSPRLVKGKAVVNLLPPGMPHKGDALFDAMHSTGLKKSIFVGDDDTDEDVFVNASDDTFTVRVGFDPDSAAKYYLRDQTEIEQLLSMLLDKRNVLSEAALWES